MSAPGPDPARAALDARALAWMREPGWCRDEARFDALALDLFAFQYEHCVAYRRFCARRDRTPQRVTSWREIPPVPTGAFKEVALASFPIGRTQHVFRTSGTATAARGALHLDTLEIYEASLLPTFARYVLPDLAAGERVDFTILAPAPQELPDSSLSHMFGALLRALGSADSAFVVRAGVLQLEHVLERLRDAETRGAPCVLCGTAFALVHLLEALEARALRFALPVGSRLMETGGFKGHSRELARDALYAWIARRLGVPPQRIVNQYGMTELGSQFYDSVLLEPDAPRRKLGPPWARVRIVDPVTGDDLPEGQAGSVVIVDLANTGSVAALQSADVGRRSGDGFEILGRDAGAEARGCSIAADAMLAGELP
ncbi:MAG: acyl-protein synthetase [Myxococcales bacterium]|nr:acyl-protein synthetase [Myxococcales bacterium]